MEWKIDPGVRELTKVDDIEQRSDYIKSRSECSYGFIMIIEVTTEVVSLGANYHLIQESDGTIKPDFNNPNHSFVDVK